MLARVDTTAQVACHELHAVADAQNRDALREHGCRKLGRARLVHARWSAGEDDPLRIERRERHRVEVGRPDLCEDAELARAPRDELRELRPEVEDEQPFVAHGSLGSWKSKGSSNHAATGRPSFLAGVKVQLLAASMAGSLRPITP